MFWLLKSYPCSVPYLLPGPERARGHFNYSVACGADCVACLAPLPYRHLLAPSVDSAGEPVCGPVVAPRPPVLLLVTLVAGLALVAVVAAAATGLVARLALAAQLTRRLGRQRRRGGVEAKNCCCEENDDALHQRLLP